MQSSTPFTMKGQEKGPFCKMPSLKDSKWYRESTKAFFLGLKGHSIVVLIPGNGSNFDSIFYNI